MNWLVFMKLFAKCSASFSLSSKVHVPGHFPLRDCHDYLQFMTGLNFVGLFVLRLNIPVNNSSVMSGRSHRFLGITSTLGE